MPSKLEQLKLLTDVVADTGDIDAMREFTPQDATTNPSLLLKAADLVQYQPLVEAARAKAATIKGSSAEQRACLLYTSPSPRDKRQSRMPSSA